MRIERRQFVDDQWTTESDANVNADGVQVVLCFGATNLIKQSAVYEQLKGFYQNAEIVTVSTSGEIYDEQVSKDTLSVVAIKFDSSTVKAASHSVDSMDESVIVGQKLAGAFDKNGLIHAMVFSDGLMVNGSELVRGISENLPDNVTLTGGLAGDEDLFRETYVGLNAVAEQGKVVLVGFYGDKLRVGHGSVGGWDPFGIERVVTKSEGSIVYELDGKPILDLYKEYLGEKASELPGSGLLVPLSYHEQGSDIRLTRTMLAINEEDKSVTYAGDVPEGSSAQLMKANFDRLIDGAGDAAEDSHVSLKEQKAELAILISCVGRKMVLRQRTDEELSTVRDVLGDRCVMTGFYSYGEIAPSMASGGQCNLQNQTMTITTLRED